MTGKRLASDWGRNGRKGKHEFIDLTARPSALAKQTSTGLGKGMEASRRIPHAVVKDKLGIGRRGLLHGTDKRLLCLIVLRPLGSMYCTAEQCGRGGTCGSRCDDDRADDGASGCWRRVISGGADVSRVTCATCRKRKTSQCNEQKSISTPARSGAQAHDDPPLIARSVDVRQSRRPQQAQLL